MGLSGKMVFLSVVASLSLACRPEPSYVGGNINTTLLPANVRIRPGQSVTLTFTAIESPNRPVYLSSSDLVWTLEGTPAYPVGTVIGLSDPLSGPNLKGRFDAAPSLPDGVTQAAFTIRAKVGKLINSQIVTATSRITLDVNAPLAAETALVQEGGNP